MASQIMKVQQHRKNGFINVFSFIGSGKKSSPQATKQSNQARLKHFFFIQVLCRQNYLPEQSTFEEVCFPEITGSFWLCKLLVISMLYTKKGPAGKKGLRCCGSCLKTSAFPQKRSISPRRNRSPQMLIDFSDVLQAPVKATAGLGGWVFELAGLLTQIRANGLVII